MIVEDFHEFGEIGERAIASYQGAGSGGRRFLIRSLNRSHCAKEALATGNRKGNHDAVAVISHCSGRNPFASNCRLSR
jgi:hypothetical protein